MATGSVRSRQKVHVTIGHQTVMAQPIFFGVPDGEGGGQETLLKNMFQHVGKHAVHAAVKFDLQRDYQWQDELFGVGGMNSLCWVGNDSIQSS